MKGQRDMNIQPNVQPRTRAKMTDDPATAASDAIDNPAFLFRRSMRVPKMKGTTTFKSFDEIKRPTAIVTLLRM